MTAFPLFNTALLAGISTGAAYLALWVTARLSAVSARRTPPETPEADQNALFLFRGRTLVDATASGNEILGYDRTIALEWSHLFDALSARFSQIPRDPAGAASRSQLSIPADDPADRAVLQIEWRNDTIRVCLQENTKGDAADRHRLHIQQRELDTLRQASRGAPYPAWQTDKAENVTWTNAAYRTLNNSRPRPDVGLKDAAPLFRPDRPEDKDFAKSRVKSESDPAEKPHWYDVTSVRFGDKWMNYAIDVTAVVNAEIAQRNFVQTLTKTFAQLSIGLAIFDRNRQLALFNPALIDLTTLPADFLSARPNLLSFFDRLRDNRMMPEPKNYSSWREQIADVVAAATDGRYHETWSLPSGLTYRITGRPHPDGAVAFLIEDISAEVSLTRRFRTQLELGQAVIDKADVALAVFSSTGTLTMCNSVYGEMWGIDPDSSFAEMTVLDASRHWQEKCKPTPVWAELRDFVVAFGDRAEWFADIETRDNHRLECRFSPLNGGATLVRFRPAPEVATAELAPATS